MKTKNPVPALADKPKEAAWKDKRSPNTLQVCPVEGASPEFYLARSASNPVIRGAMTGRTFAEPIFGADVDVSAYVGQLEVQAAAVQKGDMSAVEAMLVTQANTLDMIFNQLARKAGNSQYLKQMEVNLRLALKAQSQCRSTLEALAEIKMPRSIAFIKQQNNAAGPQQVNNGAVPDTSQTERLKATVEPRTRTGKPKAVPKIEQLEQDDGKRVDTGATRKTSRSNKALAALGEVDRTEDTGR